LRHIKDIEDLTSNESRDLFSLTRAAVSVLKAAFNPTGFNLGMNLGASAGAGIAGHLHAHVVPRWEGDTNFMPIVSETKVLSSHLDETFKILKPLFDRALLHGLTTPTP